jgi:hypothetical protein
VSHQIYHTFLQILYIFILILCYLFWYGYRCIELCWKMRLSTATKRWNLAKMSFWKVFNFKQLFSSSSKMSCEEERYQQRRMFQCLEIRNVAIKNISKCLQLYYLKLQIPIKAFYAIEQNNEQNLGQVCNSRLRRACACYAITCITK